MSSVRFTAEGDARVMKPWAKPDMYEAWLAMLPPGAYDRIVQAMNNKIDRTDVVRAQYYVVCESAEKFSNQYLTHGKNRRAKVRELVGLAY